MFGFQSRGEWSKGGLTQTAGTVINVLIPPKKNCYTLVLNLQYVIGTTAHTLTIMKPQGFTTVASAAAASQAVINISSDPGASLLGPNNTASQLSANGIAANDWVAMEMPDGTVYFDKVASVSTLAITMTNNLPTNGVAAGAKFWFFGATGDKDPYTADAFYSLHPAAAASGTALVSYPNVSGTLVTKSNRPYEPILIQSSNATAAGTFDLVSGIYGQL